MLALSPYILTPAPTPHLLPRPTAPLPTPLPPLPTSPTALTSTHPHPGTSLGGVLLPLVLPPLLARVGLGGTLRIFAGVTTAALVPFLPFIRGRVPETVGRGREARARDVREAGRGDESSATRDNGGSGSRAGSAREDSATAAKRWWTEPSFILLLAVDTLQAFGYFAPMLWLPSECLGLITLGMCR